MNIGLELKVYPHMHLSLFVVPMICELLANPFPHASKRLDLADFSEPRSRYSHWLRLLLELSHGGGVSWE